MTSSKSDNFINFLLGSITPATMSASIYLLAEPKINHDLKPNIIVNGFFFTTVLIMMEGNVDNLLGEIFTAGFAISPFHAHLGLTISGLALTGEVLNHYFSDEYN
jgi:hypothetical protein